MKNFMEAYKGFDPYLLITIGNSWDGGICCITNMEIVFSTNTIDEAIQMRNKGKDIKRRASSTN